MKRHLPIAAGTALLGALLLLKSLRKHRAMDFRDRVALITGGSRGLGLLIARELGRLGARVILVARDEAELRRAQHDLEPHDIDVSILPADISTESGTYRMVTDVMARHGRLDVLVNNAKVITVG